MSIVTYKPVIVPARKRPDGTYNLKIRITYKRKYRLVSTNITVPKGGVGRKNEIKSPDTLVSAYSIIDGFQRRMNELSLVETESMDIDDVVRWLRRKDEKFALDFFEYADRVVATKGEGTQTTYRVALNAFKRFLGRDRFDISEFTVSLLKDYEQFLIKEPKQIGKPKKGDPEKKVSRSIPKKAGVSSSRYIGKLRYIYSCAREEYNDEDTGEIRIPRDPFSKIHPYYSPSIARTSKTPEFIQSIISYNGVCHPAQRFALDIYILCFGLMGMNSADMFVCPPERDGVLIYNRVKTKNRRADNAEHRVRIEPCIRPVVEKYRDKTGKRMFDFYQRYDNANTFCTAVRDRLVSWAKDNGLEPFTLYSARHSFATIARSSRCGIGKDVVDECLAHKDASMRIADVYIEKDWTVLWSANKRVLDTFEWPQHQLESE